MQTIPLHPNTYVKKALHDVWDEFPLLLGAAVAVVVLALPCGWLLLSGWWTPGLLGMAFTLFPGLAGLFYVVGRVVRSQSVGIGHLFLGVRRFYRQGLSLGLLALVPLLMALNTYDLLLAYPGMTWLWLPLVLQLAAVMAAALTCAHALSLLALYDLPLARLLLYACAVLARAPMATVGTLGLLFLLGLIAWWTRGGLSPVALAVWTVFAVNLTCLIVRQEQGHSTDTVHQVRP
jgi:hypothetical protein